MKKSLRDKMLSRRVRYAMAHLSRKEHTALLARPNWRRLRRFDMNLLVLSTTIPLLPLLLSFPPCSYRCTLVRRNNRDYRLSHRCRLDISPPACYIYIYYENLNLLERELSLVSATLSRSQLHPETDVSLIRGATYFLSSFLSSFIFYLSFFFFYSCFAE